jgi:hypothetical protein
MSSENVEKISLSKPESVDFATSVCLKWHSFLITSLLTGDASCSLEPETQWLIRFGPKEMEQGMLFVNDHFKTQNFGL